jgi:hypothetical protein
MGEDCEMVADPLLVDVPLDDALHPVINIPLAEGTFSELEASWRRQEARHGFQHREPESRRQERARGRHVQGTPFVFSSAVEGRMNSSHHSLSMHDKERHSRHRRPQMVPQSRWVRHRSDDCYAGASALMQIEQEPPLIQCVRE